MPISRPLQKINKKVNRLPLATRVSLKLKSQRIRRIWARLRRRLWINSSRQLALKTLRRVNQILRRQINRRTHLTLRRTKAAMRIHPRNLMLRLRWIKYRQLLRLIKLWRLLTSCTSRSLKRKRSWIVSRMTRSAPRIKWAKSNRLSRNSRRTLWSTRRKRKQLFFRVTKRLLSKICIRLSSKSRGFRAKFQRLSS